MFLGAVRSLAAQVTQEELDRGLIYPPQSKSLEASVINAIHVAEQIFELGLARGPKSADVAGWIRRKIYRPKYPVYA